MNLVGIRLSLSGSVLYYDPADLDLAVGDRVIVESDGEPAEGYVVIAPSQVIFAEVPGPLAPVLRRVE